MNLVEATDQLAKAKGRSEHVMSIFMDIRGFSSFSKANESPNIAIYVKKLFLKVLKDYFPEATYAKPTGDGLLIIYPYDEDTLSIVANKVVDASLRCVEDFSGLCANEPMLNFSLPDKVGFGISRGLACCLYEGDTIIDYSGHLLNLAARLNGVARPAGVIVDGSFGLAGLDEKYIKQFAEDDIYLKGVADEHAVHILYQADRVSVSEYHRKPLNEIKWEKKVLTFKRSDLETADFSWWTHALDGRIDEIKGVSATLIYPTPKSKSGNRTFVQLSNVNFVSEPTPAIDFEIDQILSVLKERKIPKSIEVTVELAWVPVHKSA